MCLREDQNVAHNFKFKYYVMSINMREMHQLFHGMEYMDSVKCFHVKWILASIVIVYRI